MNVIEGQANLKKKFSLIFYSLTFNNILNIIVMLILVGVTINVAMQGGLFDKARNASEQTQIEADRESLLMAAMACIGTDGLDSNLPTGFSVVTAGAGVYSKGGYTFTVNAETGEIIVAKSGSTPTPPPPSTGDLSDLEKYILGADGTGR